jgi:hypothetical protein
LKKHLFAFFFLIATFSACTKKTSQNCYHAATREEYNALAKHKAEHPNDQIQVDGKDYDCVDNLPTDTGQCYQAKSKEEFDKLSAEQMKDPGMAVKVDGQSFECLKGPS